MSKKKLDDNDESISEKPIDYNEIIRNAIAEAIHKYSERSPYYLGKEKQILQSDIIQMSLPFDIKTQYSVPDEIQYSIGFDQIDPAKAGLQEQVNEKHHYPLFQIVETVEQPKIVWDEKIKDVDEKPQPNYFDLLLFFAAFTCPADQRDEMLGHMTERFQKDRIRLGETKAFRLAIWDFGLSLLPIANDFFRSKFVSLLKRVGLEVVIKYFFG